MKKYSWMRSVLAIAAGLSIGVVVIAVVNLLAPSVKDTLTWIIIAVVVSSFASALVGFLIGARKNAGAGPSPAEKG
jgi:hypothetical protein